MKRKDLMVKKTGPHKEGPLAFKQTDQETEPWMACWVILDSGYLTIYIYNADNDNGHKKSLEHLNGQSHQVSKFIVL